MKHIKEILIDWIKNNPNYTQEQKDYLLSKIKK